MIDFELLSEPVSAKGHLEMSCNRMLQETKNVRQIPGEPLRRWFADNYFELILWYEADRTIIGFQLCYDKGRKQRALTWEKRFGYSHDSIDDEENKPGSLKSTPVLVPDGLFDHETIGEKFRRESEDIEKGISDFVYQKIVEYGF